MLILKLEKNYWIKEPLIENISPTTSSDLNDSKVYDIIPKISSPNVSSNIVPKVNTQNDIIFEMSNATLQMILCLK